MKIDFQPDEDERLTHAYEEIDEILAKYRVEWCASECAEIWLETVEPKKPELKVVKDIPQERKAWRECSCNDANTKDMPWRDCDCNDI
jgi:hypothetical protein